MIWLLYTQIHVFFIQKIFTYLVTRQIPHTIYFIIKLLFRQMFELAFIEYGTSQFDLTIQFRRLISSLINVNTVQELFNTWRNVYYRWIPVHWHGWLKHTRRTGHQISENELELCASVLGKYVHAISDTFGFCLQRFSVYAQNAVQPDRF